MRIVKFNPNNPFALDAYFAEVYDKHVPKGLTALDEEAMREFELEDEPVGEE